MTALNPTSTHRPPPLVLVLLAFTTVYTVWGSTYLAIRFAVETLPPFLMAGVRFLVAGVILFAAVRTRDRTPLSWPHWRNTAVVGTLLLLGGNGLVCWAQQTVASGVAALLVATVPLWFALLDWLVYRGPRPRPLVVLGLLVGMAGIILLFGPGLAGGAAVNLMGGIGLLFACLFWSLGSLQSRRLKLPSNAFVASAMQMITGGAMLLLVGIAVGELPRVRLEAVSVKSVLALAYLIVFGAIIGYSAYGWLLKVSLPQRVSTYAYVNPVIAVLLGAAFAGEPLTLRTIVAATVIVTAVAIINLAAQRRTPRPASSDAPEAGNEPREEREMPIVAVAGEVPAAGFEIEEILSDIHRRDRAYLECLRSDALSVGVYVLPAGATDRQQPHTEDEVYYIVRGTARLQLAEDERSVRAGSLIYVRKGLPHRFVAIQEELVVIVFFAPAEYSGQPVTREQRPGEVQRA